MENVNIKPKYRIGQIVKIRTTLKSFDKEEDVYCKIINSYYNKETEQIRYIMKEFPKESELKWDSPENELRSVTLMEI